MSGRPLTVLKFGSSVLGTERDYVGAAAEVMRHLQRGERVIAVVSELRGTTDRLVADARYFGAEPEAAATAALLATGEGASAARLTLHPGTVSAQATRVPVVDGHTAAVFVSLKAEASLDQVREAFRGFRGLPQQLGLPSAPARPTVLLDEQDRPQPRLDLNVERGMATLVGRVRRCELIGYKFIALGHNTVCGAAGAALLNAELLQAQGLLTS